MLGVYHCAGFSRGLVDGGYSRAVVQGLLIVGLLLRSPGSRRVGSVVRAAGLESTGSVVVSRGLGCSLARGIFLDRGSSLCLLPWQVDSLLLSATREAQVKALNKVHHRTTPGTWGKKALKMCPTATGAGKKWVPSFSYQPGGSSGPLPRLVPHPCRAPGHCS